MTTPSSRSKPGPATLKTLVPTKVPLSSDNAVVSEPLDRAGKPPLVIRPARRDVDVAAWASASRVRLDSALNEHGAVLFRGFGIVTAEALERLAGALVDRLMGDNGEHRRSYPSGNIYTPVFFPPEEKLLWHTENSFNDTGPARVFFCCAQPADSGGETPIVDSRLVFQRLDEQLRTEFLAKKVMYVRNYGTGLGLHWREVFRTDSPREAEARCAEQGLRYSWSGDRLRTWAVRPAALRHPGTGEWSWVGQAQHWHPACLDAATRTALTSTLAPEELPRQCHFGDGSVIPDEMMAEICRVYEELEISFPWERGDVMVLDNVLVAHARNAFRGERELLVAMGDMVRFV
jgi:hypothetical protein